jgi:hypothetical protein
VDFNFSANLLARPNAIAAVVMLLWFPLVIYIFNVFPARRAIVISFITAWLFLPEAQFILPGIPNYTKISATCYGILLSTIVFDVQRIKSFRLTWLDIPITIWCVFCPLASSLSNDLGLYDGVSSVLNQVVTWGVPYFLGRIYLNDFLGLRQLAVGIFVGGLLYVPLCLFEVRMSPQLHNMLYGGHAHGDFAQTIRYDGFRPAVFLVHGLAVGAWMMAATLIGIWLWRTQSLKSVRNVPLYVLVPILLITFVLTRSTGAYLLLVLGISLLYIGAYFRTSIPVYVLVAGIAVYLFLNTATESYFSDQAIDFLSPNLPEDRVSSLEFRFNNEELLADRAREQFWLGWGGWGRALIYDDFGNQITIPDSLWIIAFGNHGMVGLISLFSALLLPPITLITTRCPARLWTHKMGAPAAALSMALIMYVTDCLVNAMINPIFILACGAIAGTAMGAPVSSQAPISKALAPVGKRLPSARRKGRSLPAPVPASRSSVP